MKPFWFWQTTKRPIVFVAHSLSKIMIKSVYLAFIYCIHNWSDQTLIHSNTTRKDVLKKYQLIKIFIYEIMFMSMIHQDNDNVHMKKSLINATSMFVAANDRLIKHFKEISKWLHIKDLRNSLLHKLGWFFKKKTSFRLCYINHSLINRVNYFSKWNKLKRLLLRIKIQNNFFIWL